MKKFLFILIAALTSFSIPVNSDDDTTSLEDMVYIYDADTEKLAYIIYADIIVGTKNVYTIDGKYVKDVLSGEKIYELYGRYVKRCKDGRRVFIIGKGYIRDFNGGKKIYTIEGKSNYEIKEWEKIYLIEGINKDIITDSNSLTGEWIYYIEGINHDIITDAKTGEYLYDINKKAGSINSWK